MSPSPSHLTELRARVGVFPLLTCQADKQPACTAFSWIPAWIPQSLRLARARARTALETRACSSNRPTSDADLAAKAAGESG